jgi:hypothetical protein
MVDCAAADSKSFGAAISAPFAPALLFVAPVDLVDGFLGFVAIANARSPPGLLRASVLRGERTVCGNNLITHQRTVQSAWHALRQIKLKCFVPVKF